ncbi:MAG: ATPase, partial [Sphingobacteriales bacterium]
MCWFLAMLSVAAAFAQNNAIIAHAEGGILDLRHADFSSKSYSLRGTWNYYPGLLLKEDELSSHKAQKIVYPALWNREDKLNHGATGVATYSVTILLPKETPRLAFRVPDAFSSYNLYSNGVLISSNGFPAYEKELATPFWETRTVNVNQSGTLRLVLQIANFWHYKGGPYKDITLGERQAMYLDRNRSHALDLLLAGCLFMGGLFFLGLFIFGTQDKAILYFSLFCIVY